MIAIIKPTKSKFHVEFNLEYLLFSEMHRYISRTIYYLSIPLVETSGQPRDKTIRLRLERPMRQLHLYKHLKKGFEYCVETSLLPFSTMCAQNYRTKGGGCTSLTIHLGSSCIRASNNHFLIRIKPSSVESTGCCA